MKISKKLLSCLLVCLLIFSMVSISVSALSLSDGVLKYNIDSSNSYAIVVGYDEDNNPITDVNIPADFYGKPVVGIAENAFVNLNTLNSVSFDADSCVTYMDECAFGFCSSLKKVTLPHSMEKIGKDAFLGCTKLETVIVNSPSIEIGNNAFYNCSALNSFDTRKISAVGKNAFLNTALEKVIINSSVKELPEYCFAYCDNLNTVVISGSSTVIASTAFYNESGAISMITAPNSLAEEFAKTNGYSNYLLGDVDLLGTVNIRDVTYIQMYAGKDITLSDMAFITSDVDFDGKVNVRDATILQMYLCKMITEF